MELKDFKPKRYFFDQDMFSSWYMIPIELKKTWERLSALSDPWNYDGWQQLDDCRLDRGISGIVFEKPIKLINN